MAERGRFRLFAGYIGPADYIAYTLQIAFGVGLRGDLMTKADAGRMVPCVFSVDVITGRSWEDQEAGRLNWVFWPRFRCEAGEIARRLAGGDDLSKQNDQAMAVYHREKKATRRPAAWRTINA